jgi:hypothetical protein
MSEKLIVSHYENNYGGAVNRLNAIAADLAGLDFEKTPGFVINGLKREELIASNSMILHEIYFASLGEKSEPDVHAHPWLVHKHRDLQPVAGMPEANIPLFKSRSANLAFRVTRKYRASRPSSGSSPQKCVTAPTGTDGSCPNSLTTAASTIRSEGSRTKAVPAPSSAALAPPTRQQVSNAPGRHSPLALQPWPTS